MGRFVAMDPLGYVDGPNGYQYAVNDRLTNRDQVGLTSKTDLEGGDLFYTWHLGWVDRTHAESKVLAEPWLLLRTAKSGEVVRFTVTLEQAQGEQGIKRWLGYKASTIEVEETAARSLRDRKCQLLWVWMEVANQFEEHQGTGIQSFQFVNKEIIGRVRGKEDLIASSFSTEDLVSNLIAF